MAQRVGRGIALLFHDCGTRTGWVVSSTPRPHFTYGKNSAPILQEAGWAPGPVWTGGKSRPHRDSIPDRPARSQSLYRLSYSVHKKRVRERVQIFDPPRYDPKDKLKLRLSLELRSNIYFNPFTLSCAFSFYWPKLHFNKNYYKVNTLGWANSDRATGWKNRGSIPVKRGFFSHLLTRQDRLWGPTPAPNRRNGYQILSRGVKRVALDANHSSSSNVEIQVE